MLSVLSVLCDGTRMSRVDTDFLIARRFSRFICFGTRMRRIKWSLVDFFKKHVAFADGRSFFENNGNG
jgi:hypothetical protein